MSESVEKDGHGVMLSSNDEASTGPAPATSDGQIHPPESMISPRGSESDIPFPFESQSSLDEENGHGCKIPNTILISDLALTASSSEEIDTHSHTKNIPVFQTVS